MTAQIDKVKLSGSQILGGVGGTLNLWIGISFVTVIELCEFLYHICEDIIHMIRDKHANMHTVGAEDSDGTNITSGTTDHKCVVIDLC